MSNTSRYSIPFFNGRIVVLLGDFVKAKVDAIVIPANNRGLLGGDFRKAIYLAIGTQFFQDTMHYDPLKVGESIVTSGYKLFAKKVIHAFGPLWNGLNADDYSIQLTKTYTKVFQWVEDLNLSSVGLAITSSADYNCPFILALHILLESSLTFLKQTTSSVVIYYYCQTPEELNAFSTMLRNVEKIFIDSKNSFNKK
jgi:O-acetyl-ADP-ribose deacetylase (regulator of RNase III)